VKHTLTIVVVVFWLGMVGLLVQKQVPPAALHLEDLPEPARAGDEVAEPEVAWFGIYQKDPASPDSAERKIGHARRVSRRLANGYRLEDRSTMSLAMLGTPQTVTTSLVAETDDDYALRRFTFTLVSPAASFSASGARDGQTLRVEYGPDGRGSHVELPLTEPITLQSALRPRIAAARPPDGTRFAHTVFSPLTMGNETITTVVEGRERIDGQEALRIVESQRGMEARAWLDAEGRVLREQAALGFELRREPEAEALANVDDAVPLDLTVATRIPLRGEIADPRGRARLTLRVGGKAASSIPNDPPRQMRRGTTLEVVREAPPTASDAVPDAVVASQLAPGPFVESDDPEIEATAARIVEGTTDRTERARRLLAWVHESMTQAPSLTLPSAREVLRTKRGDCNEHAVLLVALARAAGIPARVVAGTVYLEDGFYYHAWAELWLGRWVSADAVFDQMPADATHVKLLVGGPEEHVRLAEVVGRLTFAAVEEENT